jgi:hypothetical protein
MGDILIYSLKASARPGLGRPGARPVASADDAH